MEFRILGPVVAADKGRAVELSGPLERALLARLVLSAGTVVPLDRLIEDLWDGEAPDTANVAVRVRVSRLRKALGNPGSVRTEPPGYVLVLRDEDALDSEQFESLLEQAREAFAAGDAAASAQMLRDAMSLWTGPALSGVGDAPFARAEAARLEQMRLTALEDRIEADLLLGKHSALVAELESLCGSHPLRERFWGQRMIALYRCGRQADALACFQQLRRILSDELGIDPSVELVQLESQILNQASELTAQARPGPPRLLTDLPSGVVTFMLTDIEGSTQLWESSDAMPQALERHDVLVRSIVADHGGRLVKSKGEGDSTLSVFRRATDAVAATLALRSAIRSEVWPGDLVMSVRIALHTGEAHERDGDYFGPAVNRAARLRSIAAGDQIVLSRVTAEVARDGLPAGAALLDLGEHTLRGLSRGERVFALVEEGEAVQLPAERIVLPLPEALTMIEIGHFVGREQEIQKVTDIWKEVGTGSARTVMIAGEPGIGKTRLTSTIARTLFDDGAIVLYGRSDEDAVLPYQPFVESLRSYVAAVPKHQRGRLPHANDLSSLLPDILSLGAPKQPIEDPEVARYRLFEAVSSLVAHIAAQSPLVLVLDDLHWSDRPTLLMLRHVMRACASSKVLFLGTYRESELARTRPLSEILADLRRERSVERIALRGLLEDDVLSYLMRTAEHDVGRRGRALAHVLAETTEGNPFFIEQILGHLIETGRLTSRQGVWTLDKRVEDLGIPEGVIEAIGRRMSRLSETCNRVLTAASVVGRDFEIDVVTAMVERDADDVLSGVEEALKAGLVRELEGRARPACSFSHALVQQTMYEELSMARKQRLHLKAANAIEFLHGSDDSVVVSLARHLRAAGAAADLDKTTALSLRAMANAWNVFAFEEAITHGEATLELLEEAGTDVAMRAKLLEQLGDLHFVAGTADQSSVNCLEEAAAKWEQTGDTRRQARAYTKIGRGLSMTWRNLDIGRALDRLNAANALLQKDPDLGIEGRLAVATAGAAGYALDTKTMQEQIDRAFALAKRTTEDPRASEVIRIGATATLGWLQCITGQCDKGMATLETVWREADESDLVGVAMSSAWITGGFGSFWDPLYAAQALRKELEKPRRAGPSDARDTLLQTLGFCLAWTGNVKDAMSVIEQTREPDYQLEAGPDLTLFLQGEWEKGLSANIQRQKALETSGNAFGLCFTPWWAGQYLWLMGDRDEARRHITTSVDHSKGRCLPPALGSTARLAILQAETGHIEQARSLLDQADDIMKAGSGWQGYGAWPALARAALFAVEGRGAESDSLFEKGLSVLEHYHLTFDLPEALRLWGRRLLSNGDPIRAAEKFDAAIGLYQSIGVSERFSDVARAERADT